jgi:hypothetical protein
MDALCPPGIATAPFSEVKDHAHSGLAVVMAGSGSGEVCRHMRQRKLLKKVALSALFAAYNASKC